MYEPKAFFWIHLRDRSNIEFCDWHDEQIPFQSGRKETSENSHATSINTIFGSSEASEKIECDIYEESPIHISNSRECEENEPSLESSSRYSSCSINSNYKDFH